MTCRPFLSALALSFLFAGSCFKDPSSGGQGDESDDGDGATTTAGDGGATGSGTTAPDDTTEGGGTGSGGTTGSGTTGSGATTEPGTTGSGATTEPGTTGSGDTTGPGTTTTGGTETTTGGGEVVLFELWNFACDVEWLSAPDTQSNASPVICNAADQGQGAAHQLVSTPIETNETVDQALLVAPWLSAEGVTSGVFESLNLTGTTKPVFRTRIACPQDAVSCDVQWQMWARPAGGGGMPPVLENGFESFDGSVTSLDVDLSLLKEPIDLALSVTANGGASSEDAAVFENPRIVEE